MAFFLRLYHIVLSVIIARYLTSIKRDGWNLSGLFITRTSQASEHAVNHGHKITAGHKNAAREIANLESNVLCG